MSGKVLVLEDRRLDVRGVTYGTFRSNGEHDYPDPATVESDFALMAQVGVTAIRTYTVPPRWLLDLAADWCLHVMVGLPWEDHIAFLDERRRGAVIEKRVRAGVRACAAHPALLCFAIGNEIQAPIVRWHGPRPVERFIERLYRAVKDEDPEALVTYANYPTTEYLQLPFLDLVAFNLYLESDENFDSYLARLQNIAGDRPLILTEIGLDSRRNGQAHQARVIGRQMQSCISSGCAGVFVFAWTDEWHRGGIEVEDWDFGLTDRRREPKPALEAVRRVCADQVIIADADCPSVSVVVCTHDGAETIGDCLAGALALDYPRYDVVVVDDGSTDATAAIAAELGVRVVSTQHRGLGSARNTGIAEAAGEIVAFIDDDARPDPQWLRHLAATFAASSHAGVGGPNIPPPARGLVEAAIVRAPGNPIHVLRTDAEAEHIPGCNMAFRRAALEDVDGFDPRFRVAGDDVDVCWKLQEAGMTLGFSPGAVVWHRRRATIPSYLRQQVGYGKAEAILERKWPEKYNRSGHVRWAPRVYADARHSLVRSRGKVNYGTWGRHLFQSLYGGPTSMPWTLPLMPEWCLLLAGVAVLSVLDVARGPVVSIPGIGIPLGVALLIANIAALVGLAGRASRDAERSTPGGARGRAVRRALVTLLFAIQPVARLLGRVRFGLTPWRRRGRHGIVAPRRRTTIQWSEQWRSPYARLIEIEGRLRANCLSVVRGGDHDRWDLEARTGPFGSARLRLLAEEHGEGRQLLRLRVTPRWSRICLLPVPLLASFAVEIGPDAFVAALLGVPGLLLGVRALSDAASAQATLLWAIEPEAGLGMDDAISARTVGRGAAAPIGPELIGAPVPVQVPAAALEDARPSRPR